MADSEEYTNDLPRHVASGRPLSLNHAVTDAGVLELLGDLYRLTAMPTALDERSFWSHPVAECIFRYLRERRHTLGAAWGFDRGKPR